MSTTSTSDKETLWSRISGFFEATSNKLSESFLGNWWKTWTGWGRNDDGSSNGLGVIQDVTGGLIALTWRLPIALGFFCVKAFQSPSDALDLALYAGKKGLLTLGYTFGLRPSSYSRFGYDLEGVMWTIWCGMIAMIIGAPLLQAGLTTAGIITIVAPFAISFVMNFSHAKSFWENYRFVDYLSDKKRATLAAAEAATDSRREADAEIRMRSANVANNAYFLEGDLASLAEATEQATKAAAVHKGAMDDGDVYTAAEMRQIVGQALAILGKSEGSAALPSPDDAEGVA